MAGCFSIAISVREWQATASNAHCWQSSTARNIRHEPYWTQYVSLTLAKQEHVWSERADLCQARRENT